MKSLKSWIVCFVLLCGAAVLMAQAPEWEWAVQAGGTYLFGGSSIATDSQGNQYVTGNFYGTATFGSQTLTTSGGDSDVDIFVAKLDPDGNWLWAVQAGGISDDVRTGIAVDGTGNAWVTGYFEGTATFGSHSLTASGYSDLFVAKLDPSGNWLWAVRAEGTSNDLVCGIAVDAAGNAWVTGYFRGTATFGSHTLTSSGGSDIFVARLDPSGNWLWAVQAGGTGEYDDGSGIAVDGAGNAWVTGSFYGTATFGSHTLTSSGESDIFVARLDYSGNWLWAVSTGGINSDYGGGIALDGAGNAWVTGCFYGTATFGSHTLTSRGDSDIFVARLDYSGNWLWAVSAGGTDFDSVGGIALDGSGNAWVTGRFQGTATFGSHTLTSSGLWDIFAAKLDTSGNWLWAAQAGGTSYDYGTGIAVDGSGNTWVTGIFTGTATFGSHSLTSSGSVGNFVARLFPTQEADFSAEVFSGYDPLTVQFFDESTAGQYPIINWFWSFGDGGSSTQRHPQHTYTTPGIYTVSLTVINQNYQTSTKVRPDYITVMESFYIVELLSPASLDFGALYIGEQSAWQTIRVKNTGSVDLTFSDVHFVGAPLHFQYAETITLAPLPPGESGSLYVRFAPQTICALSDTLYIVNNSINQPVIKVALSGFGLQYDGVPPKEPENVVITMNGNNAVITWDAVTEAINGQPITPDGYLVYYNGSSDAENGLYYFLAVTTDLTHTHVRVGEFANWMFYRVAAYKYYGRGSFDLAALGLEPGMTEAEVRRRLELFEK